MEVDHEVSRSAQVELPREHLWFPGGVDGDTRDGAAPTDTRMRMTETKL